jgi:predicted nucleotide-binding protein
MRVSLANPGGTWAENSQRTLTEAGIGAAWVNMISGVPFDALGTTTASNYLHILKHRIDSGSLKASELDEADRAGVELRTWLDVWGTHLWQIGSNSNTPPYGHHHDNAFVAEFDAKMEAVLAFAKQDQGLDTVLTREVAHARTFMKGEFPPHHPPGTPWNLGWSLQAMAWLMSDVADDALPFGEKLCHFPDAQRAKAEFDGYSVTCFACGAELEPEQQLMLGGRNPSLEYVQANCESCSHVILFPKIIRPGTIWQGPPLTMGPKGTDETMSSTSKQADPKPDPKSVFVIHGRNTDAAKQMGIFLRAMGLRPVDFDDVRADLGGTPTVADVVIEGMNRAWGVIALFTGDEWAELRPAHRHAHDKAADKARWQARPNVMFEAGMAFGRDRNRVFLVQLGSVELFTDVAGVMTLRLDNNPAGARHTLREALRRNGCDVNDDKAWMTEGNFETCLQPSANVRSPFESE